MKPSSTDPRVPRPRMPADQEEDGPQVRVVRFDRPLHGEVDGIGWADPRIRERIARAEQAAREEAYSLGYASGWAQGRQAAAEQARRDDAERAAVAAQALQEQASRTENLLLALGETARQCAMATAPAWTDVADAVADGALAIARAALGRELATVDAEVADAVRTVLRVLADADQVTVHVNPRDLALLHGLLGDRLPGDVQLAGDPAVPPGGVAAATPVQRLLHHLPAAVARAEEVLRS